MVDPPLIELTIVVNVPTPACFSVQVLSAGLMAKLPVSLMMMYSASAMGAAPTTGAHSETAGRAAASGASSGEPTPVGTHRCLSSPQVVS
jgi:hypothetical protein